MFCSSVFFFLVIRRPPRSTLFPTRRSSDLGLRWAAAELIVESGKLQVAERRSKQSCRMSFLPLLGERVGVRGNRSEEHTSELQSHSDLVCRLLLEKKNKTDDRINR